MNLKALIPKSVKLKFRLILRLISDRSVNFADRTISKEPFPNSISTIQEIKQGAFFENKVQNIKNGSIKVESIVINPNQVFSFWKAVGPPTEKNGFKKGRNIINGKVSEEIGGGLCQLSSILYITSLKANLETLERHNHSVDIYKEEERFTPLGADATVVYGYKDLRIKNTYDFPIKFSFSYFDNQIICNLESLIKIDETKLDFIRIYKEKKIEVSTTINSIHYCFSTYQTMEL